MTDKPVAYMRNIYARLANVLADPREVRGDAAHDLVNYLLGDQKHCLAAVQAMHAMAVQSGWTPEAVRQFATAIDRQLNLKRAPWTGLNTKGSA